MYWNENSDPPIRFAPDGQGSIRWVWRLENKSRIHGIIHVGIDKRTGRFLCYEYPIGVYYPEGPVLERIFFEIVRSDNFDSTYRNIMSPISKTEPEETNSKELKN